MVIFVKGDKQIFVVNNEYIQNKVLLNNCEDGKVINVDDVQKMKNVYGILIFEIEEGVNGWDVVLDLEFN